MSGGQAEAGFRCATIYWRNETSHNTVGAGGDETGKKEKRNETPAETRRMIKQNQADSHG